MKYGEKFVEADVLLAVMEEDDEYAEEKLRTLLPGELVNLQAAATTLHRMIDEIRRGR